VANEVDNLFLDGDVLGILMVGLLWRLIDVLRLNGDGLGILKIGLLAICEVDHLRRLDIIRMLDAD
jgi:hypothetical protein